MKGGAYFVYQFLASKLYYLDIYLKPNCDIKFKNLIENYFLQTQGDGGGLFKGGRLLKILSLSRDTNSKGDAYLKMGANSNIYCKLWRL